MHLGSEYGTVAYAVFTKSLEYIWIWPNTGPFRRFSTHVWQTVYFSFFKISDFIKGILHIYIVFLKLKPLFLYLTYELNQYLTELKYPCLNKLASKYGKTIILNV